MIMKFINHKSSQSIIARKIYIFGERAKRMRPYSSQGSMSSSLTKSKRLLDFFCVKIGPFELDTAVVYRENEFKQRTLGWV